MTRYWQRAAKRAFDLSAAAAGLVLLCPLFVAIAATIKLTSPGPVFYRGKRVGRDGVLFKIWKFRSMVVDGERLGGTTTGLNDPRITKFGAVLRKYKLDELPQLLNVFVGDMSFVGPRPEVAEYVQAYTSEQQRILTVRPGITDWSSLEFNDLQKHVGAEDPDRSFRENVLARKNELRLRYVDDQSLRTDAEILAKTAFVLIARPIRRDRAA